MAVKNQSRYVLAAVLLGISLVVIASPSAGGATARMSGSAILGGLDAVDAGPGGQVWAVGFRGVEPYETLAERWDGDQWIRVPTPAPSGDSELLEVASIGPHDAWAVGYAMGAGGETPLVVHWDGAHWRRVPSHVPQGDGVSASLFDVDGTSASDVWAVGTVTAQGGQSRTLTMHWDGARWSRVASPNLSGGSNVLLAVSARSANNVWAVGYAPKSGVQRPGLAEHWDGTHWSVVPVAVPAGKTSTAFNAVTAQSADNVWAVGRIDSAGASKTIVERWNGQQWSIVSSPSPPGGGGSSLNGVTTAGDAAWAVGGAGTSTLALVQTRDGWQRVHSPTFPPASVFTATTAISGNDVWAVGFHGLDQTRIRLLSEHWDGTRWVAVQH